MAIFSTESTPSCFVTGCAGFIGSHLVDRLLSLGCPVTGYDNLETGQRRFLADAKRNPDFELIVDDVLEPTTLTRAMAGADIVFHLSANADVRGGLEHPRKDLEQNTLATFNVLEAMRANEIREIVFASTGCVYGEPDVFPTPEDAPFPKQTSLYGASKLAAESLIEAYCEGYGFRSAIFRFVSIVGERYSHGHIFDFCKKLRADPERIQVLGNGKQRKSYLYIHDCISGMILGAQSSRDGETDIYNLGNLEYCSVEQSLNWICEEMGLNPIRSFGSERSGWVGDSPFVFLDTRRIESLGWKPSVIIREGIIRTVKYLLRNPWLFDRR